MPNKVKQVQISTILLFALLLLGVFLALIFYLKSIIFLQAQSEFEQGPINHYIKSLRYYCFAQFAFHLPAIIYILGITGIGDFDFSPTKTTISIYAEGLASLAGFFNSLMFLKQGKIREYKAPPKEQLLDCTSESVI